MKEHKFIEYVGSTVLICEKCGISAFMGEKISCESQKGVNETHDWIIEDSRWRCKRCDMDGYPVRQGLPLAHHGSPMSCEEMMMRKALE